MKNRFQLLVFFAALFFSGLSAAQDLSSKGIQLIYVVSSDEYTVTEGGDSLFARYLEIRYINSPSGAQFTMQFQNTTDTSQVQELVNTEYTVPGADTDNSDLYSLNRSGNTIRVYLGNLSAFSRFRIRLWIESDEQPSWTTDF